MPFCSGRGEIVSGAARRPWAPALEGKYEPWFAFHRPRVGGAAIACLYTLQRSLRVAGPLYRLARKMESLSGVSMTHLSKIESRLYQLKARIEMEDTSLESVRREIDIVLAEFKKPMLSKGP